MSLDNNFLQMGNNLQQSITFILNITNFMANILADKILYSDFSF